MLTFKFKSKLNGSTFLILKIDSALPAAPRLDH
jgi:hypothetical protein